MGGQPWMQIRQAEPIINPVVSCRRAARSNLYQ
jgi:hypothetical protein